MSGRQFLEWRAYAELEPFDEVRADIRTAHLVQTVRAFVTGKPVTIADCLLPFGEDEAPAPTVKDWREIKAVGRLWVDATQSRNKEPEPAPPVTKRRRRTP